MITDARVLDVKTVPSKEIVLHRNDELNAISAALDHLLQGNRGGYVHLFGQSGTGKTCMARVILRDLERELLDVRTKYINCWEYHSEFSSLFQLAGGVGRTYDVRQGQTPHDELLRRVREADDQPYVVILDEVDQLDDKRIVYDLFRMDHVSLILVANHEDQLFAEMDERLVSRLRGGASVTCEPYGLLELTDILEERAKHALDYGAWDRAILKEIADRAAGDARVSIQLLREAARLGQERGAEAIRLDLLGEAEDDARRELRRDIVSKLNRHQRVLLQVLPRDTWLGMNEIEEQYQERVEEPRTRRTLLRYLDKMEHYDAIESDGEKRWTRYRRVMEYPL